MDTIELIRHFRRRIAEGPVFGPFSKSSDPAIVETLGHAGFDFIILDLEHGPNSVETLQGLIRAAQIAGMAPIVRVPSGDPEMIGKALDVGAAGVQVPQISSAQDVRVAIEHAKFAPLGMRGVDFFATLVEDSIRVETTIEGGTNFDLDTQSWKFVQRQDGLVTLTTAFALSDGAITS